MSTLENSLVQSLPRYNNLIWVPWLLIIYNFTANLSNDIYLPSMPLLVHVFGTTASVVQLTMTAWFAGVAIPQLIFGPLSDKIGRRPLLLAGGVCFVLATLICTLSTNIGMLIAARFLQGVGVCSLNVSTFSIVTDFYEYQLRARIMAKINICGMLAPLIGPVFGGYILLLLGWRCNFLFVFVLGIFCVIGLWKNLPESNLHLNAKALHFSTILKNYIKLVTQNKNFLKYLLPYCFMLGGLVAYLTASPFLIINRFHYSPQFFGFTQLSIFTAYFLGGFYLHTAHDDIAIKKMLKLGLVLVFVATLWLFAWSLFANNLWVLLLPMMMYGFGFSLCGSPLITEVMSFPTETKGSAAALLGLGMSISCVACCAVLSAIYNGTVLSLAAILVCVLAISFVIFFLKR